MRDDYFEGFVDQQSGIQDVDPVYGHQNLRSNVMTILKVLLTNSAASRMAILVVAIKTCASMR